MDIPEICLHICRYLSDYDVIPFLSIRKNLHLLKNKIYYYDCHEYIKVKNLLYFNNFMNIHTTSYLSNHLPMHLKHLIIRRGKTSNIGNVVFPEGLEKLDMRNVTYNYIPFEFPKSLKCLMLPINYGYQQTFNNIALKKIGLSSYTYSMMFNIIPKTINKIVLYGTCYLNKYTISDNITNITNITIKIFDDIFELDTVIPLSVKYLKIIRISDYALFDIKPLVNRNMTLIINRKYQNKIGKFTHGPDFKVEYFD